MPHPSPRPVSPLRTTLMAVTMIGLTTVGCSTPEESIPVTDLHKGTTASIPGTDEEMDELFELPIHAHVFDTAENTTLRNAHEILVEQCMRDLGFSFTRGEEQVVDPVSVEAFGPFDNYLGRWHIDAEYAAEHGFSHTEEVLAQGTEPPPEEGRDPRIDERGRDYDAAEAALWGFPEDTETPSGEPVPEGGCTGWAEQQLDEGVHIIGVEEAQAGESPTPLGSNPVAEEIMHTAFEEAEGDQRLLDAEASWSECMADAGYPNEDPGTIGSGKDTDVDMDDTEAAVRNVECREDSGLTQTYLNVLSEIQEREIEENRTALRERTEQLETTLERAVELVDA